MTTLLMPLSDCPPDLREHYAELLRAAGIDPAEFKYSPSQPRDDHGRWTRLGGLTAGVQYGAWEFNDLLLHERTVFDQGSRSEARADTKFRIGNELAERLTGNAAFDAFILPFAEKKCPIEHNQATRNGQTDDEARTELRYVVCDRLIKQWSYTSGDSDPLAVALQQAVKDEFGLDGASTRHFGQLGSDLMHDYDQDQPALRAFVRAQYDNTQTFLTQQGIAQMPLFRGAGWDTVADARGLDFSQRGHLTPTTATVGLQPASSFSYDPEQALDFATEQYRSVVAAKVPSTRILSTSMTGWGCKQEGEVVVLGGHPEPMGVLAWDRDARIEKPNPGSVASMLVAPFPEPTDEEG